MKLKGKTAFITGSNRGIGKAIVKKMAAEGANIYAHARKQNKEFEKFLCEISENYGVLAIPIYFDLGDTKQMKDRVKAVLNESTTIDILVNNAGVAHGGLFMMTKVETIKEVFDINLFSMMEITQLVLKKMIRQKKGSIINMSSVAGINVRAGNSAYGVSKAAIKAWTETLAMEVGLNGIRVNAVAPSLTDTQMAKQMEQKAGEEMVLSSAMRRMATTEEIAGVVTFLASDESSFVNGQTVIVNGGGV